MMHLNNHNTKILIDCKHINILVVTYFSVSSNDKGKFGKKLWSALSHSDLGKLDLFGEFRTIVICNYSTVDKKVDSLEK